MKNVIKLTSAILSLILCLTVLAGCKSNKEDEVPKETTFNYEIKPIADEPHSIDALNDAVTIAITEGNGVTYPDVPTCYFCENHNIVASTFEEDANSFDVLAHRDTAYYFEPDTGNYFGYRDLGMYCLISLVKAESGYDTVSYEEFSSIDDALTAADGVFGDADAVKESYTDTEYTPYRYSKDGKVYLLDYDRYITYCDNLIAEMINATAVTDSYKPIITKNKDTYNKFLDTHLAMDYVIGQFLNGEADSPKAYVLYRALEDMLEKTEESIDYKPEDEKKAQTYFEKVLESAKELREKYGALSISNHYPVKSYLIYLYDESLSDEEALAEKYMYANPDKIVVHSADASKEFSKGSQEYADILRANQRCYISEEDAFSYKANVKADTVLREYYSKMSPDSDKYIEYVYNDGKTPDYIFSDNSALMLVPAADGRYNAYTTGGNSSLRSILDSLFE